MRGAGSTRSARGDAAPTRPGFGEARPETNSPARRPGSGDGVGAGVGVGSGLGGSGGAAVRRNRPRPGETRRAPCKIPPTRLGLVAAGQARLARGVEQREVGRTGGRVRSPRGRGAVMGLEPGDLPVDPLEEPGDGPSGSARFGIGGNPLAIIGTTRLLAPDGQAKGVVSGDPSNRSNRCPSRWPIVSRCSVDQRGPPRPAGSTPARSSPQASRSRSTPSGDRGAVEVLPGVVGQRLEQRRRGRPAHGRTPRPHAGPGWPPPPPRAGPPVPSGRSGWPVARPSPDRSSTEGPARPAAPPIVE